MRLIDLHPQWLRSGGEGITDSAGKPVPERVGIGVDFDCPCLQCTSQRTGDRDKDFHLRNIIFFTNPLDGGPPFDHRVTWKRTGETFDTLVLRPSILNKSRCGWHGFVGGQSGDQPGEVVTL